MFLPAYLIWALWVGLGYQWLIDWAGQPSAAAHPQAAAAPVLALKVIMAGAVVFALAWNWPLTDLSHDRSTRVRGEKILELARPDALIVGWWGTVPVVEYLQLVEGQRTDIQAMNRFLIRHHDLLSLLEREIDRRPVYIDEPVEGCRPRCRPPRSGHCSALSTGQPAHRWPGDLRPAMPAAVAGNR
jgi:hypothetical protein